MEINEVLSRIISAIIRDIQAEEEEKEKLKKKIEKIMKELNKKDEQLAEFCLRKQQCEISLAEAEYAAGEYREFYFEASNELKEMQSLIQKEKEKENQKKKENADKKKEEKQIQKDAKEGEIMKMRFEAKMEE
ncbi:MAG: hypothetical protein EZS28_053261 [Streblomastix strix]|uniref:Uncharacterized protein n=1 Tax=Streblomastix strix TaxID=222440 RepID=A0A5J4RG16_9EUKA|nr:MAG: hypothetical protein EZS28_053261 [Streblomastix strix]